MEEFIVPLINNINDEYLKKKFVYVLYIKKKQFIQKAQMIQ